MNSYSKHYALFSRALLISTLAALWCLPVAAQWPPFETPTTPTAQRSALNSVAANVNWLQNATRTAPNFGEAGYGKVSQSFERVRRSFHGLKQTLTPQQLAYGANSLAELDAGLDIIQEAFTNYQEDVAAGQPVRIALRNLGGVLREATNLWLQELNNTCSQLRVGRV
jgi:hypothetical protein